MVAPLVVLAPPGFAVRLAAVEQRVQVQQLRLAVPPAVPLPVVVLPARAAVERPARPLQAVVQLTIA